ncbi:hypothetical protein HMPREF1982_01252 [Clostridiales bacterium oral taxon 876 str. F0540]|nr:hypothetical protein HMPREF1982_01252 [Clostridiales bacterium oral taxon 876 str. F0540]
MFSLKNESRFIKISLLIISSIFLFICLYTIFKYGNSTLLGSLETYDNDDVKYIRSAHTLLSTGVLTYKNTASPTVFIMPGLPYILSFFMKLFGAINGVAAFRVMQAVLQTLSLLLIFFIGRRVFNNKIGLIAMFLDAIYIPEIWASNLILTEVIFKFLFLLLIYFCLYAVENNKVIYYIIGGVIWGLSALFRPPIALFPIVILIMWIKKKYSLSYIIKYTVIVSSIFVLIMSPWWIRNYKLYNAFIPFTVSSGNPMLQGTYINYNDEDGSDSYIDRSHFKYTDDEIENDRTETEIAKLRIKTLVPQKPLQYIYWYTVGKTVHQFSSPFYWGEILGFKSASVKKYHLFLITLFISSIFIYLFKRKTYNNFSLLINSVIYTNCIYLPFFCFSRYMFPIIPIVTISAAFVIFEAKELSMKLINSYRIRPILFK